MPQTRYLNTSRDGDSIPALGSLFQSLSTVSTHPCQAWDTELSQNICVSSEEREQCKVEINCEDTSVSPPHLSPPKAQVRRKKEWRKLLFHHHFKPYMVFSKASQPCLREVIFTSLQCNRLPPRETPAALRNFCKCAEMYSPYHRKELSTGDLYPMGWELLLHQSWWKTKVVSVEICFLFPS